MSDTPRTDAAWHAFNESASAIPFRDFARQLEREVEGWKASFAQKDADLQEAKQSIALLKEYHDVANKDRSRMEEDLEILREDIERRDEES